MIPHSPGDKVDINFYDKDVSYGHVTRDIADVLNKWDQVPPFIAGKFFKGQEISDELLKGRLAMLYCVTDMHYHAGRVELDITYHFCHSWTEASRLIGTAMVAEDPRRVETQQQAVAPRGFE